MKILIFIENNILDENLNPIAAAVEKINTWIEKGAEVDYLTGTYKFVELKKLTDKFDDLGLSTKRVHARQPNEKYVDIVQNEAKARVFVENQENSGEPKYVSERLKDDMNITSIVLEPKQGLDHLPDDLEDLKHYGEKKDEE